MLNGLFYVECMDDGKMVIFGLFVVCYWDDIWIDVGDFGMLIDFELMY